MADQVYPTLHEISKWVVSIDNMITKDQIDILENRPDVVYLRTGDYEGENPSVIVSTKNSGNRIIDRIEKFLKKITEADEKTMSKIVYDEARTLVPKEVLSIAGLEIKLRR